LFDSFLYDHISVYDTPHTYSALSLHVSMNAVVSCSLI